ncbi:hypothetical protein [Parvibaculum sp.]|uniref:hypothetical protein n=1 Tax=Parvibaculum sp. TaxID=2024848 RepID=UPI002CDDE986|nr:hypothetical protein [Parvibaculum sp.]HUD53173.1 hypothetical protein [Parvibaculum sp.]
MTLAALKPQFARPFAAETVARPVADILPWTKSTDMAERPLAVRDTLGAHLGNAAIATYALFTLAHVLVRYAI